MTENRYMLITIDDGSCPSTLQLDRFANLGELERLETVPSRFIDALHGPFMDFVEKAQPGDAQSGELIGSDYALICESTPAKSPAEVDVASASAQIKVPLDLIELMAAELEWHNEEMRHDSRELAVALRALCGRTRRGDEGPFGWRERLSSALSGGCPVLVKETTEGQRLGLGGFSIRLAPGRCWISRRTGTEEQVVFSLERDHDGGSDWHRTDPVDAPEPSKSPADVEELKRQWLADGCWDIEHTEGFEAHEAELIEWRLGRDIAVLEAEVASLRAQLAAKRPRLFEFANGSEVDVDRYLALDATAHEHRRPGDSVPVATFQLHHSYHRVYFESDEQRASELERMRAFRDGRVS
jgi:hypothetical protein